VTNPIALAQQIQQISAQSHSLDLKKIQQQKMLLDKLEEVNAELLQQKAASSL